MIYVFPDGRSSTLDLVSSSGSWIGARELLEVYELDGISPIVGIT